METKITVTPEEVAENMKDVLVRTVEEFGKPCTYVTVRMKNGFTLRESTTCVDPANWRLSRKRMRARARRAEHFSNRTYHNGRLTCSKTDTILN